MELTSVASAEGSDGMFVQCEPAVAADKTLSEFFHTVKALQRSCSDLSALEHAWGDRERDFAGTLESAKVDVHAALCDNVDTPRALRALLVRCVVPACHAFTLSSLLMRARGSYELATRMSMRLHRKVPLACCWCRALHASCLASCS
jgi:hypothetical protein